MMTKRLLLAAGLLWIASASLFSSERNDSTTQSSTAKFEIPRFTNLKVRTMLRTEFRAEGDQGEELTTNFRLKPAMLQLTGDFGKYISFFIRNRFDWSTELQSDGTPLSLIVAHIEVKPTEKVSIILGKQMMMMGGWEFDYNPTELFFYSMVGNYLQAFQTGASVHWSVGKQSLAVQLTKVTEAEYHMKGYHNAWNSTFYWGGDFFNGLYKPILSYTFTNAGEGNYLHSLMIGNQFNVGRFKIELDAARHNAMRYYSHPELELGHYQAKTTERTYIAFAEYNFPGDRFQLGVKGALDRRSITESNETVNKQLTTSTQLRYRLLPKYGISLHAVYGHVFDRSNKKYAADWKGTEQNIFATGMVWDFTTK